MVAAAQDCLDEDADKNGNSLKRRVRAQSENAIVADSTSDDTNSDSSGNDEDQMLNELCKPMTSMLGSVVRETCRKFVFDA